MKGIILAGGSGTRLHPLTAITTKQLLPVFDSPMVYYPLSTLMLCGIKDVLLISTPQDIPNFENLLGNGNHLGLNIEYKIQDQPRGIAEAFILGEEFIGKDHIALILGDNVFHGDLAGFRTAIKNQKDTGNSNQGHVFAYPVSNPTRYGVVEFDSTNGSVKSIEEKPQEPKSNYAIPGFYLFDETVSEKSKSLKPSARGELEILDVIQCYLDEGTLSAQILNRGLAWLDMGTPKSLLEAGSYISAIYERQGLKVACLEEIALRMKFINEAQYKNLVEKTPNSPYREYLQQILSELKV